MLIVLKNNIFLIKNDFLKNFVLLFKLLKIFKKKYNKTELNKNNNNPEDDLICGESARTMAEPKIKIFIKYKKEKKILVSDFALIFLLKLKIINSMPVIIINNKALVDLTSSDIKGVGYISPSIYPIVEKIDLVFSKNTKISLVGIKMKKKIHM